MQNISITAPKVSICVVTYNQEKYISQCLDSIIAQKAPFSFEIIVSNDASTDSTKIILKSYEERYPKLFTVIHQSKNIGGLKNYLAVHQAARGDYVCHIDGDDWINKDKLFLQKNYLDENVDCILVAHRMDIWENEKIIATTRNNSEKINLNDLLLNHPVFLNSSIMYRREKLGAIFFRESGIIDYYVYISAAVRSDIGFMPNVLGNYRNNVGISRKRNLMPYIQNAIDVAEKNIGSTPIIYRARAKQFLSYSIAALLSNEDTEFRKNLNDARKADDSWKLLKLIKIAGHFPILLRKSVEIYKWLNLVKNRK